MKAIIFDLGNVLVHYDHQATIDGLTAISTARAEQLSAIQNEHGHALGVGAMDAETFYQILIDQAGMEADFDVFLTAYARGLTRNDEALTYAVELQARANVTVGIMSNTNQAHVAWLDEFVPELDGFDVVMMSNEVHLLKPDPDIYLLMLQALDTTADQAIFIDDLAANVTAAQQLGLSGIVHSDWTATRPALETWLST